MTLHFDLIPKVKERVKDVCMEPQFQLEPGPNFLLFVGCIQLEPRWNPPSNHWDALRWNPNGTPEFQLEPN